MIKLYSTSWCGPCKNAKRLLDERGISYDEIDIDEIGWSRDDLYDLTGGRTVPQIVIDEKPIGGYGELLKLDREGKLEV